MFRLLPHRSIAPHLTAATRALAVVAAIGLALAFTACKAHADTDRSIYVGAPTVAHVANLHPANVRLRFPTRTPYVEFTRLAGRPLELHPLVAVAKRYVGSRNFTGVRAAWCAAALRNWLAGAGYSAPRSNRAIDFAHYGRPSPPRVGAIMVARHHVGVVVGLSARGPVILSGNWSRRVGIGTYAARRVIAYREPV